MLAQFSIWPLDDPHLSDDVADVTAVLDDSGVNYEVGPMSTTLEGDWDDVMKAIGACHASLKAVHKRVLTSITIDEDVSRTLTMSEALRKVANQRETPK